MNHLYYGDCLTIMQDMQEESVDLIYLDPPFNSNRDYHAIYKDETGRPLPDQIANFNDIWSLDTIRTRAVRDLPILMREQGIGDEEAEFMRLFMAGLKKADPKMLAYLSYMAERILEMRRLLKPTGSIYFHCDPTASHYLKILMDTIFGRKNFRNEIAWCYGSGGASKKHFSRKHDTIFFYTRNDPYTFNVNDVREPYSSPEKVEYKEVNNKKYRRKHPLGRIPFDWWQIPILTNTAKERLGYATQKPVSLLDRIIKASTNEGDLVLDPFCGCATTLEAAHKLERNWIGIDIAIHAVKRVAQVRLTDKLGLKEKVDFTITGVPHTQEGARDLWTRDAYSFQKWAVEQVDGFVTTRKTGDGGIDGRLYFTLTDNDKELSNMVLEVKGGKNVGINIVRDLRGVLAREDETTKMAGLILLEPLSDRKAKNFAQEMAEAGDLEVKGITYPRMQMLTVADILDDKRFIIPSVARGKTQTREPKLPHSLG